MKEAGALSLLAALRASTADAHRSLEQHPLLAGLARGAFDRADCIAVLLAFRRVYLALEPRLLTVVPGWAGSSGYHYEPRLPLLERDLMDLGVGSSGLEGAVLEGTVLEGTVLEGAVRWPAADQLARFLSPESLPGTLYVLEGATQGGRILATRVAERLALEPERGTGYFRLYRQRHWFTFRALLEQLDNSPSCRFERAAAAARGVFILFHRSMDAAATRDHASPLDDRA